MNNTIVEAAQFAPNSKIIKNDDGSYILKDVVLLSEYSKNPGPSGKPRRYPQSTQEEACKSFDNLPICVNHPAQGVSRDTLSTIGKSVNPKVVVVQEGDKKVAKTVGDVHLISGPASDHIVKLGELDHRLLGMSITGDGKFQEDVGGFDNVAKLKPNTSDFVHRPATTKGLFESIQEDVNIEDNEKTELLGKLSEITDELEESFGESNKNLPKLGEGVKSAPKERKPAGEISESAEKISDDSDRPGRLLATIKGIKTSKPSDTEESEEVKTVKIVENEIEEEDDEDEDDDDEEVEDDDGGDGDTDDVDSEEAGQEGGEDTDIDSGFENPEDEDSEEDSEDGDEVDPTEGNPEDAAKAVTDQANAATFEANTQNTPEAHMDAVFAHCGACAQLAGIDKNTAYAHFQKANEHNEVANNLKDKEAPDVLAPAPETAEESVKENVEEGVSYDVRANNASRATAHAEREESHVAHMNASTKHDFAAEAAEKSGNKKKQKYHEEKSMHHAERARELEHKTEEEVLEMEITEEVMKKDFETMGITPTPVLIAAYSKLSEEERPEFLKQLMPALIGSSRVSMDKVLEQVSGKKVGITEEKKEEKKFGKEIAGIFKHTQVQEDDASKVRSLSEVVK